jgi:hypothetical protein
LGLTVLGPGGIHKAIDLALPSAGAPRLVEPDPPEREVRPHWPAWIGAGVSVVGLAVGVYYVAVSKEARAEGDNLQDKASADRDYHDAHNAKIFAVIALGVAAASALTTIAYYEWP